MLKPCCIVSYLVEESFAVVRPSSALLGSRDCDAVFTYRRCSNHTRINTYVRTLSCCREPPVYKAHIAATVCKDDISSLGFCARSEV